MRFRRAAALALAVVLAAPAALPAEPEIRRLEDGARLAFDDLVGLARAHDLVVMGEIHDNPRHQALQARLAAEAGVSALALEMAPREAEAGLLALRAAEREGRADAAAREAARWDDYAPWHVVLAAVPQAAVAAAGVPRETLSRAMTEGAAAAFDGDPAGFGLDVPLSPEAQADLEAELLAAHCDALPEAMLPGMAEAQRLRDAAFAEALLRARARAKGQGPAMLVTGNGHAREDRGVPAFLARAAPELEVLTIVQVERPEAGAGWRAALAPWTPADAPPPFDVAIVTDPEPREDPCARFLRERGAQAPAAD